MKLNKSGTAIFKSFEKKLYKLLKVEKWKGKALTYNPELFLLKNYSYYEIANTMTKAETDQEF